MASLHSAAGAGDLAGVRAALDHGSSLEDLDDRGWTALQAASQEGKDNVVKFLISRGANVNKQDEAGQASLHLGVSNKEVIRLLLEGGANPNITNPDGYTPLHYSSFDGHAESAKVLLRFGADKKKKTSTGETALALAKEYNHKALIQVLK
mmetsp:Transcript_2786/g.3706  ORF Transcript_2786/g.3706 Transcript_2786/m.3706 type:complete len:151 (+) Transcript_2786:60-512(+)